MKFVLIAITLVFSIQSQAQSLFSSDRQAKALAKMQSIVVPTDLKRIVETADTVVSSSCTSRNEHIVSIDPNSQEKMMVQLTSYYSSGAEKTVIVLPPTGGVNKLDYKYAQELCKSGMNAIILLTWTKDTLKELDPGMHDRNALRAITAIRSLLTTINEKQKIGIFGTSVGGILGALIIGLEARITTGLFLVAGAGMTEIMAESTEQNLTELRELRTEHFKFGSIGDYYELLDQKVVIDPLDFANYSGVKKVGFMVSTSDSTVPTKTQYDLVNAWGGNDQIFKTAPPFFNHLAAIVHASTWWTADIVDYFKVNL